MGFIEPVPLPHEDPVEIILLGTGTSSSLPHVDCLTAPPDSKPCRTCLSTLRPEGKKNIRRNTSAALRIRGPDGVKRTIIIDVGKNFQQAAIEWFPKYGLRRLDAVLITHPHADAMNGLDDLRGWTLNNSIQPHVDLYVSMHTFKEVQRAFPYLVSKEFASGGGDVPEFKWHIIDDQVPFEIEGTGLKVTPFSVHHGRYFSTLPPNPNLDTTPTTLSPSSTNASTPPDIPGTPNALRKAPLLPASPNEIQPYPCFGFIIQNSVIYLSDVSYIPEDIWPLLRRSTRDGSETEGYPVLVLDCLRLQPHTSHFGLSDAVAVARRIGAQRTYFTGFGHEVSHDEYVTIGEAVGGVVKAEKELTPSEKQAMSLIGEGKPFWLRPAFDGLRIYVSDKFAVRDEEYGY